MEILLSEHTLKIVLKPTKKEWVRHHCPQESHSFGLKKKLLSHLRVVVLICILQFELWFWEMAAWASLSWF